MSSKLLSASILSADLSHLADQIKEAELAGVDWIHVDVMDGAFVPTITMGPVIVEACRRVTDLPLDVHLMVNNPSRHIVDFINAGANILTIHIEACPDIRADLSNIRSHGCKAGIVLNPDTSPSTINSVFDIVDLVLVMSVFPGASGQSFLQNSLEKISQIHRDLESINSKAQIEVDGGVNLENIKSISDAGADVFVAATAIFRSPLGIHNAVKSLKSALK
ncbi:MAG: ribulose-phosphate 3-epimerase [Anaerolineaceae bacterium]|nr:ribulose-phosphate 3-epimerase [Anaerolineaceae bacterium]